MHSVNVRNLKNNPSQAIDATENGPVLVLKGNEPRALMVGFSAEIFENPQLIKRALAAALFKDGVLSLGRAAKIAGTSVSDFISHISDLGIPIADGIEIDARTDMETLEEWLGSS